MLNLINLATIKNILSKHNLAPNKFLGQNFLIDQNALDKIIEAADLKAGDNALEIGPGLGTLTAALCGAGANVVAIEKDKELIPILEENLKEYKNLKIINDDFLQVDFDPLLFKKEESGELKSAFAKNFQNAIASESPAGDERGNPADGAKNTESRSLSRALMRDRSASRNDSKDRFSYKIVSNIPYCITSPVLRKIFSFAVKPTEIVFLVQREVAERIAAKPGEMSFISVFVQFYGAPSMAGIVKQEAFWPAPKVESAILKIVLRKKFELPPEKEKELWRLAKIGFSSRRKTLANNLAAGFHKKNSEIKELLKKAGFGEKTRAQELEVEEWIRLLKATKRLK